MLKLYIGNKNYSSWSMRPWVLLRQANIEFEEVRVRFDSFDSSSSFKKTMGDVTPVGKVPALVDDGFVVWTAWPLLNTWPKNSRPKRSGRRTRRPGPGRAASVLKCTAVLAHFARLAP